MCDNEELRGVVVRMRGRDAEAYRVLTSCIELLAKRRRCSWATDPEGMREYLREIVEAYFTRRFVLPLPDGTFREVPEKPCHYLARALRNAEISQIRASGQQVALPVVELELEDPSDRDFSNERRLLSMSPRYFAVLAWGVRDVFTRSPVPDEPEICQALHMATPLERVRIVCEALLDKEPVLRVPALNGGGSANALEASKYRVLVDARKTTFDAAYEFLCGAPTVGNARLSWLLTPQLALRLASAKPIWTCMFIASVFGESNPVSAKVFGTSEEEIEEAIAWGTRAVLKGDA